MKTRKDQEVQRKVDKVIAHFDKLILTNCSSRGSVGKVKRQEVKGHDAYFDSHGSPSHDSDSYSLILDPSPTA